MAEHRRTCLSAVDSIGDLTKHTILRICSSCVAEGCGVLEAHNNTVYETDCLYAHVVQNRRLLLLSSTTPRQVSIQPKNVSFVPIDRSTSSESRSQSRLTRIVLCFSPSFFRQHLQQARPRGAGRVTTFVRFCSPRASSHALHRLSRTPCH